MKHISTTLFLLLFALPVFSQFELNVGFEADFKFNDKTENLVPNSGMLFYGFNAAIGYGITPTFRMGIQSGGIFTSGEYTEHTSDPNTGIITNEIDVEAKMSMIPMLVSIGTTVYSEKMRYFLEIAGGPYFVSRTFGNTVEKGVHMGFRPNVGIDYQLTNNLMIGIKSHANVVLTKPEDYRPQGYDSLWGEPGEKVIFLGGASIGLTYVFL